MKTVYILIFFLSSLLYGSSEYKVKAVYIYNIANLLKDKKISTHPIKISKIKTLKNIDGFQIIFISKSETDNLHEIKEETNNKTVLLISDIEDFALKGGHIEIKTVMKKLKLIINNNAALKSNIYISSKLLKISKVVNTK